MASSASLQRFLPPSPHAAASSSRRRPSQCRAVTVPSSSSPAVSAERLEPRVEQKDGGYWLLKEKFRTGLNPQEKVKLEKEPMGLFMEDGIKELAKVPMEQIDANKISKDDVDVRLKWLGLFHRRKHQCTFPVPFALRPRNAFSIAWCLISGNNASSGISDEETPA
jgi:ferredoxin-nitrite reductase